MEAARVYSIEQNVELVNEDYWLKPRCNCHSSAALGIKRQACYIPPKDSPLCFNTRHRGQTCVNTCMGNGRLDADKGSRIALWASMRGCLMV